MNFPCKARRPCAHQFSMVKTAADVSYGLNQGSEAPTVSTSVGEEVSSSLQCSSYPCSLHRPLELPTLRETTQTQAVFYLYRVIRHLSSCGATSVQ